MPSEPSLCFFCRSLIGDVQDASDGSTPHALFQVDCAACGCRGPVAPSEQDAIFQWNRLFGMTAKPTT